MKKYYIFNKEKLEFSASYFPFIAYLIFFIVGFLFGLTINKEKIHYADAEEKIIVLKNKPKFSEKALKNKIKELNIRFPNIVFAQAKIESGNFKSKLFVENNNIFGMKQAQIRPNTSLRSKNGYAYYDWWDDSLVDYALYQNAYLFHLNTEEEYLEYIQKNYAEDTNYVNLIKQIIGKEKS